MMSLFAVKFRSKALTGPEIININIIICCRIEIPDCDYCTTADKYGWFILYAIDGGSGKITDEKKIYS